MQASASQNHPSSTGQGQQRLGEVISCDGPRGLIPEATFMQGWRSYCWCWYRWHIGGSLDLCQQPAYRLAPFSNMHRPLLSLCGKGGSAGGGHTLRGNTTRSGLKIRVSVPKTRVPTLPPIGLRRPLRIEEVCASHLASVLVPPIVSKANR